MIFAAFYGTESDLREWQQTMRQHGNWLGLTPYMESRPLDNARHVGFCWLCGTGFETRRTLKDLDDGWVALTAENPAAEDCAPYTDWQAGRTPELRANAIYFGVSARTGEIGILLPPATPEQFYFAPFREGEAFSNDMRFFLRQPGCELDARAIYALFQFGAIPPPLTLAQNVRRLPGGHGTRIQAGSPGQTPLCAPVFQPGRASQPGAKTQAAEARIECVLDGILMRAPHAATLFFSGGVDSALLAARLAQAGRNDIRLVNYAFGAEDEESRLALRIADCLGLECHRILHDVRQIPQVFESLGKSYTYPYGDISVVPTKLLVENAIRQGQISGTVIEGTGADGGFGVGANYPRWQKLYSVPAPARWAAAESYRALKLWRTQSRQEHLCRIARKSVAMPMRHAAMAENALEGIAYVTPRDIRASLRQMIEANLEILSVQTEEAERLSLLDVTWVCAGRMASKSFDPLRAQGIQPIYPFLEPPMVALSSALAWEEKAEGGEPKAVLKRMLARVIPSELVYRRKSGFTPPQKDLLATPAMREFLHDVALSQRNPLLAYCRTDIVRQIVELMQRGQPLGESARDFLWALAFTSGWLAQVQG